MADQPPLCEQAYCSPTHDLPRFRLVVGQTSGIAAAAPATGEGAGSPIQKRRTALRSCDQGTIARRRVAGVLDRIYLGPDIAGALLRLLARLQKYDSSTRCGYTTFEA